MKIKLNKSLLKSQNVSKKQKKHIISLHKLMNQTFKAAKKLEKNNLLDFKRGKEISNTIKDIEFRLQEQWNFKQDDKYHTYQNKIPGCKCPILDNIDMMGTGIRWTNINCKFHGYDPKTTIKEKIDV